MQQTIALLSGWDGMTRRLVKMSPSGAVYTCSPPVKGITNLLADQDLYNWQGTNIETSEVIVKADSGNSGNVWVNIDAAGVADTGFPLDAGEWVKLSINNLQSLHVHIVTDTEKAVVVYTR
jgi:hypothetical protein